MKAGVSCTAPGSSWFVPAATFRARVSITPHVNVTPNRSPMRISARSVRHQHRMGAVSISPGRAAACGGAPCGFAAGAADGVRVGAGAGWGVAVRVWAAGAGAGAAGGVWAAAAPPASSDATRMAVFVFIVSSVAARL